MDIVIQKTIYFINFNHDHSCFCIGNNEGYEIYNTQPFKKIVEKKLGSSGVCYITMLSRSNILGIVLKNTLDDLTNETKLLIWDDKENKKMGCIEFTKRICNVFLYNKFITVSLCDTIYIYNLHSLTLFRKIKTFSNSKGLLECYYNTTRFMIGCLSKSNNNTIMLYEPCKKIKPVEITAHKSEIRLFKFSNTGNLIATTSTKGTLIRIYHTLTGDLIKELRRGSEQILIDWIQFSNEDKMILCRSKKGTIHLFNLKENRLQQNKKLSFVSFFKNYLPKYFDSEWGFAHFHFPNKKTISVFSTDLKHIIVISFTGMFYKINFTNNEYVSIVKEHL